MLTVVIGSERADAVAHESQRAHYDLESSKLPKADLGESRSRAASRNAPNERRRLVFRDLDLPACAITCGSSALRW
jgi:hypothetical protein